MHIVLVENRADYFTATGLAKLAADHQLVPYEMSFLEVKYNVKLTDVAKILIEYFDVALDHLECDELVVVGVDQYRKEQICIS